jgi:replicative DNA helicase
MASKYVDITSIMQVIGCVYNNPSLLEQTDKYVITDEDFPDTFHKVVFGAIYNIYNLGASK